MISAVRGVDTFELLSQSIDVAGCSYYMALIVSREHRDLEMVKKVFLTQVQELRAKID